MSAPAQAQAPVPSAGLPAPAAPTPPQAPPLIRSRLFQPTRPATRCKVSFINLENWPLPAPDLCIHDDKFMLCPVCRNPSAELVRRAVKRHLWRCLTAKERHRVFNFLASNQGRLAATANDEWRLLTLLATNGNRDQDHQRARSAFAQLERMHLAQYRPSGAWLLPRFIIEEASHHEELKFGRTTLAAQLNKIRKEISMPLKNRRVPKRGHDFAAASEAERKRKKYKAAEVLMASGNLVSHDFARTKRLVWHLGDARQVLRQNGIEPRWVTDLEKQFFIFRLDDGSRLFFQSAKAGAIFSEWAAAFSPNDPPAGEALNYIRGQSPAIPDVPVPPAKISPDRTKPDQPAQEAAPSDGLGPDDLSLSVQFDVTQTSPNTWTLVKKFPGGTTTITREGAPPDHTADAIGQFKKDLNNAFTNFVSAISE